MTKSLQVQIFGYVLLASVCASGRAALEAVLPIGRQILTPAEARRGVLVFAKNCQRNDKNEESIEVMSRLDLAEGVVDAPLGIWNESMRMIYEGRIVGRNGVPVRRLFRFDKRAINYYGHGTGILWTEIVFDVLDNGDGGAFVIYGSGGVAGLHVGRSAKTVGGGLTWKEVPVNLQQRNHSRRFQSLDVETVSLEFVVDGAGKGKDVVRCHITLEDKSDHVVDLDAQALIPAPEADGAGKPVE
jgi:hypothetical protein